MSLARFDEDRMDSSTEAKQPTCRGRRVDPTTFLGDHLMPHVFSYLSGAGSNLLPVSRDAQKRIIHASWDWDDSYFESVMEYGRGLTLKKAVRLHTLLRSVSQKWKDMVDANLCVILGHVHICWLYLWGPPHEIPAKGIQWICQYRPWIASLAYPCKSDSVKLNQLLGILQTCDTKRLCWLYIHDRGLEQSLQLNLHRTVAQQCPSLEELILWTGLSGVARSLLSMASLRRLNIQFCSSDDDPENHSTTNADTNPDLDLAESVSASLPNLERLEITASGFPMGLARQGQRILPISSDSLRALMVSEYHQRAPTWVKCKCARLEYFECAGDTGSLPIITTQQQWNAVVSEVDPQYRYLESTAGVRPFVGLDIPSSCHCTVWGFQYHVEEGFEAYQTKLRQIQEMMMTD